MAMEIESSGMSPRISFSYDFCQSDVVPVEQLHPLRSNSTGINDFDFCVRKSFDRDSSSADELFSDGKILPTEVKKKKKSVSPTGKPDTSCLIKESSKDNKKNNSNNKKNNSNNNNDNKNNNVVVMRDEAGDDDDEDNFLSEINGNKQSSSSKSFWRFKRSSSLNCGSGYGRSLCPLPSLLSRSNSTGSASKFSSPSKDHHNNKGRSSSSSSSNSSSLSSSGYMKPPIMRKSGYGGGGYGNNNNINGGNIHVSPVLNVPSGNLFGLGSIFFNGKDKNKKK